jgi:uncharacterized coiled-coil DUF342 family protein
MDMNDYIYQDLMEELRDRRTDATEMDARIHQLLGDTEQLRKERDELRQQVENIKNGFEGGCYLCEVVGEMNKKLLKERDEAREIALKYEDRYFSALVERDEARREVCDWHHTDESGCVKSGSEETAIKRGWDCFKNQETT